MLALRLYRPDLLVIIYNPALRMHTTPALQEWMDATWQAKLTLAREQGFPLFDGQLFRLVSAEAGGDGKVHLVLGRTGYKENITSRQPPFAQGRDTQEGGNPLALCPAMEPNAG